MRESNEIDFVERTIRDECVRLPEENVLLAAVR
jgi:hypothetical protein